MKKIKVLYISANGYFGGAEQFVYTAVKNHIESKSIYAEIFFFNNGNFVNKCQNELIPFHLLPFTFRLSHILKLLRAIIYLRKYLVVNHFDIIHCTMPYPFIVTVMATLFLKIKITWFQHGPVGQFLDLIANLLPVDRIYFNTQFLQNEHLKMLRSGRYKHLHKIINYGIIRKQCDTQKVLNIKKSYADNKLLFLIAGRISPWKGYENVIKAVNILVKNHKVDNTKFHLLIIGDYTIKKDKPYADSLKKSVLHYNLSQFITFLRHVDDLENYIKASDVFIHASTIPEPFGLVVAEAMIEHTLVVGSDVGGVTSILQNNVTGLSFPSTKTNCFNELADILNTIIAHPHNYKNLTENAYQQIIANYSVEQMIKNLETDYLMLCEGNYE
ncbi:MAG: hypothetical protein A2202_01105 [Bdellovibrionales bacterium RIFOXYA1_FULL_36_14]|nr:MAG: hypothetical protein A2202_01105 [Bdellovibrionales bacterium RIFOXYA1_FULL_36_14]